MSKRLMPVHWSRSTEVAVLCVVSFSLEVIVRLALFVCESQTYAGLYVQDKENPNEEKTTPTSAQLAPPRSGMPAPKWRTAILRESSGNPDVNLAPNLETPAASESSVESSVANVETSATEVTPTEVHNMKHVPAVLTRRCSRRTIKMDKL